MWDTHVNITFGDWMLLGPYIILIYIIFYRIRNRLYPEGHPLRPYFIKGLSVKIFGAIFVSLLYSYYYPGGDTINYTYQSQIVNSAFSESASKWFHLVFHLANWYDADYIHYTSELFWYNAPNNYAVVTIASIVSLFTFNTFFPTAVAFAALSYTGMWAMFRTFVSLYPKLIKHIALVILFIPSTFIWGSGIFKDTVCMFALGWIVHGTFTFFIQKRFKPFTIIMTAFCFYIVMIIKIYILVAFIPALLLWIAFTYSGKIKLAFFRGLLKIGILALAPVGLLAVSSKFSAELGQYSLDKLSETSTVTSTYIASVSEGGSSYNIGKLDPSVGSFLKVFPAAVNVSLFRPYLWESRKPIVLFNALEAFLFLFVTIKVLVKVGPKNCWKAISTDANIQFALIFTLIFAFAVGISSANFGALSRYRIPCLPMYGLSLMLIYYKYKPADAKLVGGFIG